jgi:hypothetical protein
VTATVNPLALPPEIVAELRHNAEETLARHQPTADGRCSYCSMTWLHTDSEYPCPPVKIALEFLRLTAGRAALGVRPRLPPGEPTLRRGAGGESSSPPLHPSAKID